MLALELILQITEKFDKSFCSKKAFAELIKNDLIESLLKNCVSLDQPLINISFSIFNNLV